MLTWLQGNVVVARELARRYGDKIVSTSLHPGNIRTDVLRHMSGWRNTVLVRSHHRVQWHITNSLDIDLDNVASIIWSTYTAVLRDVTFNCGCQWKVFHSLGTTWGTEQGCVGSSSWREVVVLAGGRDEEILIMA